MAAMDVTLASYLALTKIRYPEERVQRLIYEEAPLLALLSRDDKFTGTYFRQPVKFGGHQGASRSFATAQANVKAAEAVAFNVNRAKDYGVAQITTEALLSSGDSAGAFMELSKEEIEGSIRTVGLNLSRSLYSNRGDARGVVGSIASGVLTLADPRDAMNFEIGMKVTQGTTDGTSGTIGAAAAVEITKVDRVAGTLTAAAWTGFSATNYLFREGDFTTTPNNGVAGIRAWIPTSVSSGESFFGVDRSVDPQRLAGTYLDGSSLSPTQAIELLDTQIAAAGGYITHLFANTFTFNMLRSYLGSQVVWDKVASPSMVSISFNAIVLKGVKGQDIKVIPDQWAPAGEFIGLNLPTWKLRSLGGAPRLLTTPGYGSGWVYNADAIESRIGYFGNLMTNAPGWNGRVKVA